MAKRTEIQTTSTPEEKQETYKYLVSNLNKAMNSKFYFEGLLLVYAILEDRARSVLYHCGFTQGTDRSKAIKSEKIKREILAILEVEKRPNYRSFNNKLNSIHKMINWALSDVEPQTEYQRVLRKSIKSSHSLDKILSTVSYINGEWREKRNQLIHGLANKDYGAAQDAAKELCEEGIKAFRVLDQFTKVLKNKKIRKQFNIQ